jgi:hypothetical protein
VPVVKAFSPSYRTTAPNFRRPSAHRPKLASGSKPTTTRAEGPCLNPALRSRRRLLVACRLTGGPGNSMLLVGSSVDRKRVFNADYDYVHLEPSSSFMPRSLKNFTPSEIFLPRQIDGRRHLAGATENAFVRKRRKKEFFVRRSGLMIVVGWPGWPPSVKQRCERRRNARKESQANRRCVG